MQLRWPDLATGANKLSLADCQRNFSLLGACEARFLGYVRHPLPTDPKDESWRPINRSKDSFEPIDVPNPAETYPDDLTRLYYWLPTFWRAEWNG